MQRRALLGVAAAGLSGGCLGAAGRLTAPVPADCPTFDTVRTICAPGAVRPPVLLVPERWKLSADGDWTCEFVLRNRSGEAVEYEPTPALYRRTDGEWDHLLPPSTPNETTTLDAGETVTWTLVHGDPAGVDITEPGMLLLPDLRPTLYALFVAVEREEGRLYCAAPFELVESG